MPLKQAPPARMAPPMAGRASRRPIPPRPVGSMAASPRAPTPGTAPRSRAMFPITPPPSPPRPKSPGDGKKAKKFALRAVAAVLCCAMVSFASVGIFAALIQTGVVNVESTGSSKTAAFTLYKNAGQRRGYQQCGFHRQHHPPGSRPEGDPLCGVHPELPDHNPGVLLQQLRRR